MIDWYKKVVFENYANFKGRARRSEFWYFMLGHFIIVVILLLLDKALGLQYGTGNNGVLRSIYSLVVFLPYIAVSVRRLHDVGKSGWILVIAYALAMVAAVVLVMNTLSGLAGGMETSFGIAMMIACVVIFAISIYMIVLFCTNGDQGPNKYGPDPKGVGEEINEIGLE